LWIVFLRDLMGKQNALVDELLNTSWPKR
jgi:hypothetical protein